MPNQPKTPVRGVRIPDTIWKTIEAEAKQKQQTPSAVVRDILAQHIQRNELDELVKRGFTIYKPT